MANFLNTLSIFEGLFSIWQNLCFRQKFHSFECPKFKTLTSHLVTLAAITVQLERLLKRDTTFFKICLPWIRTHDCLMPRTLNATFRKNILSRFNVIVMAISIRMMIVGIIVDTKQKCFKKWYELLGQVTQPV